jgi:hypothetical protein
VREPYEEFLWWLQMPELLHIAGKPSPSKAEVHELSNRVREILAEAEKAGYRLQSMLGQDKQMPTPLEEPSRNEPSPIRVQGPDTRHESATDSSATDQKSKGDSKKPEDTPIESKK